MILIPYFSAFTIPILCTRQKVSFKTTSFLKYIYKIFPLADILKSKICVSLFWYLWLSVGNEWKIIFTIIHCDFLHVLFDFRKEGLI